MNVFAQFEYQRLTEDGKLVFKGECKFEDLLKEPTFDWMQKGVKDYQPDSAALLFLQKNLAQYDIIVMMGTWCGDTKDLLPKFYKTLQMANYPMLQLTMYGLNRKKEALNHEEQLYKVTNIPVFILFKNHREIGRITESVQTSIEKELVKLMKKNTQ
jgi:thiol-disulfide isomerase/thioredoxin